MLFISYAILVALIRHRVKYCKYKDDSFLLIITSVIGISFLLNIILTFIFICSIIFYSNKCLDFNEKFIKLQKDDLVTLEEKYEKQKSFIIDYSKIYSLEEELSKFFDPQVLLKLSKIKTDNVLLNNIKSILEIDDDIYNVKLELNKVKGELRVLRKYKFFIPTFISPIQVDKKRKERK